MSETLLEKEHRYFFSTYKRLPIDIVKGEGCYLIDRRGHRYLDFFGGLAVNALGHSHPAVIRAIHDQVDRYMHVSNYYLQEPQVRLAEKLVEITGYSKVFFSNSGTEAVEGVIKLARKWGKDKKKSTLVSLTNSFHGRSMGALSLTARDVYRRGYDPFLPDVLHVPFNDVQALRSAVNETTLAVFLECVQGEGGIHFISRDLSEEVMSLRKQFGFLIVADEIQSGIGRTGKFFGYEHLGLEPDLVIIAKAIGGGLPLGAFLGNERVADVFTIGAHGTTFGGNPVSCAAGIAVLEEVIGNNLIGRAAEIGGYLKKALETLQREKPESIKEVRGLGCMLGIDLTFEGQSIADELRAKGILVNCTNTTVLRLLPPYIVTQKECDILVGTLGDILQQVRR